MLDKTKKIQDHLQKHPLLTQLRDVRAIGLLVFLAVALAITWSGTKAIQRNYELQKEISHLSQENAVRGLENNNIKLQNQYYNTDQYLELKARQDFGLGLPGEKLLLVPQDVALSYVDKLQDTKDTTLSPESQRPAYQRHFQAWMDFFLHRQREI